MPPNPRDLSALSQKPPKIKVVLVKQALAELQQLLDDGWKIAANFQHAQGALFLMAKE